MQLTPVGPSLGPATGHQLHQCVGRVVVRPCCSSTCSSRTGMPSSRALQQQGRLALPQQSQHSSRSSRLRGLHLRSRLLCSAAAAAASGAGSEDSSSQQQAHVDHHHQQQQQHQAQQPQRQLPPSQRLLSLLGRAFGPAMLLAVAAAVSPRPSHAAAAAAAAAANSRCVGALIFLLHIRRMQGSFTQQQYASFTFRDSTTGT